MIIDNKQVITGLFNFTNAADHHNGENVLLPEDEAIAVTYWQNCYSRETLFSLLPNCLEMSG